MQSEDIHGNIVQSLPVDLGRAGDLIQKIEAAKEKGAVKHTIGELPQKDATVEINGLKYRVEFADFVRGASSSDKQAAELDELEDWQVMNEFQYVSVSPRFMRARQRIVR